MKYSEFLKKLDDAWEKYFDTLNWVGYASGVIIGFIVIYHEIGLGAAVWGSLVGTGFVGIVVLVYLIPALIRFFLALFDKNSWEDGDTASGMIIGLVIILSLIVVFTWPLGKTLWYYKF